MRLDGGVCRDAHVLLYRTVHWQAQQLRVTTERKGGQSPPRTVTTVGDSHYLQQPFSTTTKRDTGPNTSTSSSCSCQTRRNQTLYSISWRVPAGAAAAAPAAKQCNAVTAKSTCCQSRCWEACNYMPKPAPSGTGPACRGAPFLAKAAVSKHAMQLNSTSQSRGVRPPALLAKAAAGRHPAWPPAQDEDDCQVGN